MPVTATHLTTDVSGTDGTTFTTASITPGGNRLVLAATWSVSAASPPAPTLSGNGLTWVQVVTILNTALDTRLTLFRALGASPSSGAVTITHSASVTSCNWSINDFLDVDTGGTNGSAAVVQSASAETTGATSVTVTLAAFGSADNATYGGFGVGSSTENQAPGTGFTELAEASILDSGLTLRIQTEWRNDNDTTVDQSSASTADIRQGVAVEIKFAAGSADPVPTIKKITVVLQAVRQAADW